MKRILIYSIILMLVAVFAAQAAGDAAKGKDLYDKKCKMCHGPDGAGAPAMVKKYGDKMKPLNGADVQGKKDAELVKGIGVADAHKAIAKTLKPADIDDVVAHIRTLKK